MSRSTTTSLLVLVSLAVLGGCNDRRVATAGPTFGQPCTGDGDCTGGGEICSNHAFPNGTIYPQPICITQCTVQDPAMPQPCEAQDSGLSLGLCVGTQTGQTGWCLPACSFDSTTYTVACAGQNACQVRTSGIDRGADAGVDVVRIDTGVPITPTGPTVYGLGVCWGGCKTDTECTNHDHCQVETGECLHTTVAYTKTVGTACDTMVDQSACNCLAATGSTLGYCSRVCTTGGFDCISGFTCSAQLPNSGTVRFGGQPNGIQGHCLMRCVPPPPADSGVHDTGVDATATDGASVTDTGPPPPPRDSGVPTVCPNSVCGSTAGVSNVCLPGSGM